MRRTAPALALALALLLGACGSGDGGAFSGRRLENPWTVPGIALKDTDGSSYSLASGTQDHPLTLLFFGYTHCPDFCPLVMNNIAAAFNRLSDEDRDDTGMVFVTSDPARDTGPVLRHYLDGYNRSFVGLTGPLGTIVKVGDALHVYVSKGKKLASGGYDTGTQHSTFVLGIEDGQAVAMWDEATSATDFATDIHTLLHED